MLARAAELVAGASWSSGIAALGQRKERGYASTGHVEATMPASIDSRPGDGDLEEDALDGDQDNRRRRAEGVGEEERRASTAGAHRIVLASHCQGTCRCA